MDELFNVNETGEEKKDVTSDATKIVDTEIPDTGKTEIPVTEDIKTFVIEEPQNSPSEEIKSSVAEEVKSSVTEEVKSSATEEVKSSVAEEVKSSVTEEVKPFVSENTKSPSTGETKIPGGAAPAQGVPRPSENVNNRQQTNRYYSKYDQYRKQAPYEDRRYGTTPSKPKKKASKEDTFKKIGFVAGLAVVFALIFALVFSGASMLLKRAVKSASLSKAESTVEKPEEKVTEEVVLGNQDSANAENDTEERQNTVVSNSSEAEAAHDSEADGESSQIEQGLAVEEDELTAPEVVKKVMPSMVSITNVTEQEYQNIFGQKEIYRGEGGGSGIIVGQTEDAYLIATNNHVIDNSTAITVTFEDETTAPGEVKGSDVDYDLAIVAVPISEVSEETQNRIRIVSIGDSDSLMLGEPVLVIGNAMGYGQSVTQGIVSALGRQVTESDGTVRTLIQTDASINPGNSGGALVNMKGELIGINEQKDVGVMVEGIGYAIPMSIAKPILTELGSKTAREVVDADHAAYLGISCMTMPSQYTMSGYPGGAYVSEVVKDGPSDKAGVKEGDIITAMDGVAVSTKDDLVNILATYSVDETITLSISRFDEEKDGFEKLRLDVVLGSKKEAGLLDEEQQEAPNPESDIPEEGGENPDDQEDDKGVLPDFDDFFGNDKGFFDFFG